jgi:tRNA(fMet)-specific endonuclease VapC
VNRLLNLYRLAKRARIIASLDLLIAAHALGTGGVLVSNDQAFRQIEGLLLEDWTI